MHAKIGSFVETAQIDPPAVNNNYQNFGNVAIGLADDLTPYVVIGASFFGWNNYPGSYQGIAWIFEKDIDSSNWIQVNQLDPIDGFKQYIESIGLDIDVINDIDFSGAYFGLVIDAYNDTAVVGGYINGAGGKNWAYYYQRNSNKTWTLDYILIPTNDYNYTKYQNVDYGFGLGIGINRVVDPGDYNDFVFIGGVKDNLGSVYTYLFGEITDYVTDTPDQAMNTSQGTDQSTATFPAPPENGSQAQKLGIGISFNGVLALLIMCTFVQVFYA